MFGLFFTPGPVRDLEGARAGDRRLFASYFAAMMERGVYLAPSPFESNFLSTAHSEADIDRTIAASDSAIDEVLSLPLSSGTPAP
jgi:glutamate-1-semialdehyde 2,1-aminomutase